MTAAERLADILKAPALPVMEIPRELRAGDILLSEQQREAIELALNSSLSIILGGAGCGKTTLIEAIVHCFRERNDAFVPYVVAAPTGKAARNLTERTGIEARTVHGALGKSPDANFLDAVSWNCIGLVVVDEASMVSLEMLAGILNRVRRNCRVALLGDPNQLLSVGAGNVLSDLLCEEAARRYRAGESIQVLSPVRAKTTFSVQALNTRLQNEVNPLTAEKPTWGKFRDGDRVIVTQNNAYYNICNGDVGVLHIRGEKPHRVAALAVRGTLKTWQIDHGQGEYGIGHDDAPPPQLALAYALTVHKSQGSQYDTVLMPVSMATARMLYRNLLYTAISRAGKEVILVGEPRGAEHRDAVHPIPAQIQARRPDQPAAPWAQRVRRRHGEKGVAALSRHRRCRHGSKPPPPAAGEGIQREGAAGIPRSGLPAGRVRMAGGKEPSERR